MRGSFLSGLLTLVLSAVAGVALLAVAGYFLLGPDFGGLLGTPRPAEHTETAQQAPGAPAVAGAATAPKAGAAQPAAPQPAPTEATATTPVANPASSDTATATGSRDVSPAAAAPQPSGEAQSPPTDGAVADAKATAPKPSAAELAAAAIAAAPADKGSGDAPRRFPRILVEDAGTLKSDDTIIHLAGVVAPAAGETCKDAAGTAWPCGNRAKTALRSMIRFRTVECRSVGAAEAGGFTARCTVAGDDLSLWLVEQGWARATADADREFQDKAEAAKKAKRGLWRAADSALPEIHAYPTGGVTTTVPAAPPHDYDPGFGGEAPPEAQSGSDMTGIDIVPAPDRTPAPATGAPMVLPTPASPTQP